MFLGIPLKVRALGKSWKFYDPSINKLLVKGMETGPHAVEIAYSEPWGR